MTAQPKLLCAFVGLLAWLAAAAAGQEAETAENETPEHKRVVNGQGFGDWRVRCEAIAVNETACVLEQRLVRADSDRFLAEILAFWSADGTQAFLAARVPNGVFLPSGFAVRPAEAADDAAQTVFEWQLCSPDLCEALHELAPEDLAAFEGAGSLIAGYRPSLSADPLVFQLGISGLDAGMTALRP